MHKVPLEEAPFEVYLHILKDNGYNEDADMSELFYVETLTTIEPIPFTKEQVMKTPFKNLVAAVEKILKVASEEIKQLTPSQPQIPLTGKVLVGGGADKLTPEQLSYLAARQAQLFDEEKTRMVFR